MTLQGVPLFYPFSKTPHVLISNPQMRMRSGSYRAETIAFFIFIILQISLLSTGIIEKGFWTTYNQTFATTKHIYSEFTKADDLLVIDYMYREGTEEFVGSGYLIASIPSKATLLIPDSLMQDSIYHSQSLFKNEEGKAKWLILDNNTMNIQSVVPRHTGKKFRFLDQYFFNITTDSLNQLTQFANIRQLEISATGEFFVQNGRVGERKNHFKGDYLSNIFFQVDQNHNPKDTFIAPFNPRISGLKRQIQHLKDQDQVAQFQFQKQRAELLDLESTIQNVTDIYRREKMQLRIRELRKLEKPASNDLKIEKLQAQVQDIQNIDYYQNRDKQLELEQQYQKSLPAETRFTGWIKMVKIE